ncbi:glycosyltransferase family 4 protein [bacterium]|nr:glycosyltransferase family 4 protein [bacterium]
MVKKEIETFLIKPQKKFMNMGVELWYMNSCGTFIKEALSILKNTKPSFIYQRCSLFDYSGAKLSRLLGVPFVFEYNGSEVWVCRNWGNPLKYESLARDIEVCNFKAADLIVVVSKPLQDELMERGIEQDKILLNPNGVDPDIYSPEVDGTEVRNKYALSDKTVLGFIGTFGRWHGAEVLAEAFGVLLNTYPGYKDRVRLLMIGDGLTMPLVKENLKKHTVDDFSILTGLRPQEEGPQYLAACDILVSPHVPNPDGTPFFGSPTKLFEYMATGKGIVASDMDQIGEILEHKKTAWLVKPHDIDALVEGLKMLIDNRELRISMGQAARKEVVEKYTWKEHTGKIIVKLKEIVNT